MQEAHLLFLFVLNTVITLDFFKKHWDFGVTLKCGMADRGTCRPPEPAEPAEPRRNKEISRLPKLRALRNVVVFSYYSNLSLMSKCDFI